MFNCLIVDDEPIARDIIKTYCGHLPSLNVVAACGNALEAKQVLQQQTIHILFLDIHMPVLDGIAFLKTLRHQPQVIFTTAYKEYAVNAFDLAACDYLVKPFSLERFIVAVDKAIDKLNSINKSNTTPPSSPQEDYFFIKADGKTYKLFYNDVLFAEAKGNYTNIITAENTIMPNTSFTNIEALLPVSLFIRVHRSFIINKSKITLIEGNTVHINTYQIPIGSSYKEGFLKQIGVG